MSINWEGIFCALWTPTDETGALLENEYKAQVRFLLEKKVHGIMPLGSTGEFPHLTEATRKRAMELVAESAQGLPIIFNTSDIRPGVVADLGRHAHALGAAAVSILPPYFFPLAQEDLVEFFVRSASAAPLPVFLYNFPERTGNRITIETISQVADKVPVAGVKQSGADFGYHADLVKLGKEKNFVVFTGADTRMPEAMAMGVKGCVSGLSNSVPEWTVGIFEGLKKGDKEEVQRLTRHMDSLAESIEAITFPLNVAASMEARGIPVGHPKACVSEVTRKRYQELVNRLTVLFRKTNLI